LFPNTTDLNIDWRVSDSGLYDLEPTQAGDQLRSLKHLHIILESHEGNFVYHSQQAAEARMILASLHMPSLEWISIDFKISNDGLGYARDFELIRDALCGIESAVLQKVELYATMPIWSTPFPDAWVSDT
jgi:hypothetical protein